MKNQLIDLNNHLFAQIERLGEENLTAEQLQAEIDRSKAITSVSNQIVSNASLALKAKEFQAEYGSQKVLPKMLGGDDA